MSNAFYITTLILFLYIVVMTVSIKALRNPKEDPAVQAMAFVALIYSQALLVIVIAYGGTLIYKSIYHV